MAIPAAPPPIVPDSPHREDAESFVRWALACLQLAAVEDAARPLHCLAARIREHGPALHTRPRQQPLAVADVAARLYPAYTVDGGQVHLAGCQLTDHPFMRLSFAGPDEDPAIRHVFVAPDGSAIADHLVHNLGLDDLEPIPKPIPKLDPAAIRSLEAAGRRIAVKGSTERDPAAATVDPIAVAVIWVRHVDGRLQFTIGSQSVTIPFSSWARLLEPPPMVGRESGAATFHVAATSDGRIEAAEHIARCEQSGQRVLDQELVQCSVTGKHVLAEFTEVCPVSGRPALRSEFDVCGQCRQRVSKSVLQPASGRMGQLRSKPSRRGNPSAESLASPAVPQTCQACRSLAKVSPDDPRLLWIFNEHPGLDRWKRWRLSETTSVYVAEAAGLLKRLLVVVDKEALTPRRLATSSRFAPQWIDASDAERNELLK